MAAKPEEKKEEVKKIRNPPIKLEPEQKFTDNARPHYDELVKSLEEGKTWFTKEQCHEFWQKALDRDLVPEVWDPLWEKLPKIDKAKNEAVGDLVVVEPQVAWTHSINRGIEIGMVYTRLRTHMERKFEVPEKLETDISDFFKNDYLSDVQLVHPQTGAVYKCHRVIIASGSQYFADLFRKYDIKELPSVRVPEPFNQHYENSSDDQVIRILKYIYSSQDIYKIKNEVSTENIFNLYAQAFALRCHKLLAELTDMIITELLSNDNVAHFYQDAIEFENDKLQKACEAMIVRKFDECMINQKEFLLTTPRHNFARLLQSDDLNIPNEFSLIELCKEFFAKRADCTWLEPQDPQTLIRADIWNLLSDAERAARNKVFTAEKKAITDKATAQQKTDAEVYETLGPLERIQFVLTAH